ncbi:MAG TPA: penicillin-binding transpeptidase domain-containing protein [Streptosporangiaceae bacterium]|nr:penicillin-binding transpeptidase domain-containing protein [Streptosporangiaceae bacterium]
MRYRGAAAATAALTVTVTLLTAACSSPMPGPRGDATAFLNAWARQDWGAMRALTQAPPANFEAVNQAAFTALGVRQATFAQGFLDQSDQSDATASELVTERLQLNGLGQLTVDTTLHLTQQQNGKWLVNWTPSTIVPQLKPGDRLRIQTFWPHRGQILAANGTPLAVKEHHQWQAITAGLADGMVGTMGPVTAQELKRLGAPYQHQNVVGQSGLQAGEERRLAGSPGATITVVNSAGATVSTIRSYPAQPGKNVRTTIDLRAQQAAEAALASEKKTAALVAVDARTGEVLAAASVNAGYDAALAGGFPPGSTFKILDSTALIERGLTPESAASCPKTITEDGEVFHNAEGDGPVSTVLQAFTESCNTAFIGLVANDLNDAQIEAAAAQYRIGKAMHLGLDAFPGSVPKPKDGADLAATSIGQGRVLMAPLDMAMVAAAVDTGTVHAAKLVNGTTTTAAAKLPSAVVNSLHTMMASVVSSGTAAGTGLPAGTYAKTGTAEYGTTKPLKLDAWLVGFHGDIAFAAVVVDSPGDGGPTCGPIVARFLSSLG